MALQQVIRSPGAPTGALVHGTDSASRPEIWAAESTLESQPLDVSLATALQRGATVADPEGGSRQDSDAVQPLTPH